MVLLFELDDVVEFELELVELEPCDDAEVTDSVIDALTWGTGATSVWVTGALMAFEITEFGFVGLIGLIGLTGLFIFVVVIIQVFDIVDQDVQVGEPYGSEHIEVLDSVIKPLYPG